MLSPLNALGVASLSTLFTLLTACSSSAPPASSTDCSMSMPVNGAITATLTGDACGAVGGAAYPTSITFSSGDLLGGGESTTAQIAFSVPLAGAQTGTFTSSVEISQSGTDAGELSWKTPDTTCSVTIASNVSKPDPTGVFKNEYAIDGHGTCSQPAVASAGQAGAGSITISPFTFHGFINPS